MRLHFLHFHLFFFLFFSSCSTHFRGQQLFMYCSWTVAATFDYFKLQISLFSHFFIKNRSHGTIHTFKFYFATVFSVFSFSKISFYPIELLVCIWKVRFALPTSTFCIFFFSSCECGLWGVNKAHIVTFSATFQSRDPQTSLFSNFFIKKGHTVLFTHLKIILLQYFSVFNGIQTDS